MKVLGIESSCDETSAAVVEDGVKVLSNVVSSQIPVHAKYGGVVPELASRAHVLDIVPVVREALLSAGDAPIDAVAVTKGPGLVGSLLVGIEMAKALAYQRQVPLVGVHHVEAHLMAPLIQTDPSSSSSTPLTFPFVGLVVSGGHTSLYLVQDWGELELLGQTRDDAAGEALDKVGKLLGLGYPGGMHIDRLAATGDPKAFDFPRGMRQRESLEFSFSGLKTSVAQQVAKLGAQIEGQLLADVCASTLEAVVAVLVRKSIVAAKRHGVEHLIISGGVSANRRLRQRMAELCEQEGLCFHVPPRNLCTDNAAMIAGLGYHRLQGLSGFEAFELNAQASWPLG
ncbi:MAG: tRNA (adenosine(37)-N6)-threonylcarbamoyltransferase complex transferase subunit TsaD [Myxococcota bacterium]|nr:tRNA (adenosine(37)-N6)-threonylcarbamoyltransferase complex transferase subunit TsaD [Myxococcota bacterium]